MNKKSMPNPFPGFNPQVTQNIWINTPATPGLYSHPLLKTTQTLKRKASKGIKAGNNGILIHVILDESSSMNSCWDQTIDAFNEWLFSQQQEAGACNLTICKFNGTTVNYITENTPINEVEPLNRNTYRPSGMTNLLDAIGDNLERIDVILRQNRKKKRPGAMVIVMTDGEENCSGNFSNADITSMVKSREGKDWVFTFLGADIDAFAASRSMGFNSDSTLQYSKMAMSNTMEVMSGKTTQIRGAYAMGLTGDMLSESASYSANERTRAMSSDDDNK